ncbi:calcineurin temperature suppressor cts1 [Moniliophthora roreri]|uniref:Putative calcineurin temperature suppressor cts1 n=1 Tax=Moniliophthora roreri TaxID=221103 RepID=A0A0W0FSZ0_MONRR|nr:calcineurin temperature suppressor cts1 [Moniliophthora roreri]
MSSDEEIGTLIVVVLKARNLNDKHFYKQDVYATISLNGVKKTTKTDVKGGQHPVWDDELRFPVMKNDSTKFRMLETACYSKERRDDDLLGEGKVDISDTLQSGEFDEWVPLQVNGVARGDIYLEMTYYSNGPAPVNLAPAAAESTLLRRPSKLAPSDRLWRPPQGHSPPQSYSNIPNPNQNKMGPPTPPKTSPKDRYSALPPQPENPPPAVPSLLKPGLNNGRSTAAAQSQHLAPSQTSTSPQRVPTILRPSNPKTASEIAPTRHSSMAPSIAPSLPESGYPHPAVGSSHHTHTSYTPPPTQYTSPIPSTNNTYRPTSAIPNEHQPYTSPIPSTNNTYRPPSAVPSENWNVHQQQRHSPPHNHNHNPHENLAPISFSFPIPDISVPGPTSPPSVTSPYDPLPPGGFPQRNQSPYTPLPPQPHPVHRPSFPSHSAPDFPTHTRSEESLPDPYLIARYQTPLPLPPGAEPRSSPPPPVPPAPPAPTRSSPPVPPHDAQTQRSTSLPPKPPSPPAPKHTPSLPVPAQSPVARQATPISEERLRLLREAEERAARRKEQEERDAELARQLFESEQEQAEAPPPPPSKPKESPEEIARRLEAEAEKIRKEQEEKDLELARQLDRELNLNGDDDAPRGRMPGGM